MSDDQSQQPPVTARKIRPLSEADAQLNAAVGELATTGRDAKGIMRVLKERAEPAALIRIILAYQAGTFR